MIKKEEFTMLPDYSIEKIQEFIDCDGMQTIDIMTLLEAQDALRKQVPCEPIIEGDVGKVYFCPKCYEVLRANQKHCSGCGQAIDWSERENESQDTIADRIKKLAKGRGISIISLLSQCGLGVNTISKLSMGKDIYSKNLAKIADCLGCSVDYLLGRTTSPIINQKENH